MTATLARPLMGALLVLGLLMLASSRAAAQAVDVFGGASELAARNSSEEFALPSDGQVLVPTFGAAVGWRDRAVGLDVEVVLPRTMTTLTPGLIKSGPVKYVVTQRELIISFLAFGTIGHERVRLKYLAGLSLVRNETSGRYDFNPEMSAPAKSHPAWSGGIDLTAAFGHFLVTLPNVRLHYLPGITPDDSGFATSRTLLTVGATVGWRF
jgi:hypothetical protein